MPTVETSIWLALRGRMATLVLSPVHTVSYPNEAFTPPQTSTAPILPLPYLRVDNFPNRTQRLFIPSGKPERYQGILQVSVMSLLEQNAAIATEHAGLVAAHFPADLKLSHGGRTVRITKKPEVARGFREAERWMTPVSIYYECFA
jgi:hypothetical protein